jgi:hypothetical protein
MLQTYRKMVGSNIWHFCSNCATWPIQNYIESENPKVIEDIELCVECIAQNRFAQKKCAVIVNGKRCGLDLVKQPETLGIYQCPMGHCTLILPDSIQKKPN